MNFDEFLRSRVSCVFELEELPPVQRKRRRSSIRPTVDRSHRNAQDVGDLLVSPSGEDELGDLFNVIKLGDLFNVLEPVHQCSSVIPVDSSSGETSS